MKPSRISTKASKRALRKGKFYDSSIPASNIRSSRIPGPGVGKHAVLACTRWVDRGAIYPQTSAVGTSDQLKLSQIPGVSEFTGLFDFFRIVRVDALYLPASMAGATTATTTTPAPSMLVCCDFDESVAVSYNSLLEREDCQVYNVLRPWEVTYSPLAAQQSYGNGTTTSGYNAAPVGTWFDTQSDPSFYGLNFAFPATAAAVQFGGRLMLRVHLEFAKVI